MLHCASSATTTKRGTGTRNAMASSDRSDWKARIDRALAELKSADGPAPRCGGDDKRAASEAASETSSR